MKKIVYGILATISGLVLLFSYRTSLGATIPTDVAPAPGPATTTNAKPGTPTTPSAPPTPAAAAPSAPPAAAPSAPPAAAAPAPAAPPSSGLKDGTFAGSTVNTQYGAVAVQITVSGGTVTDVQVPEYPSESSRDRQINASAIPRLVSETLNAQSAHIDMVSGATYTSEGYLRSLQSALDRASA